MHSDVSWPNYKPFRNWKTILQNIQGEKGSESYKYTLIHDPAPDKYTLQSIQGEKGSESCKYNSIHDPASDKYTLKSVLFQNRKFTNRPKITKVLNNFSVTTKNYHPVLDKFILIWI